MVTIFPGYLAPLRESLLGKAIERGQVDVRVHDLRRWTDDVHRTVDDTPYGGGGGMVLRVDVLDRAVRAVIGDDTPPVIYLSPQGRLLSHDVARELAQHDRLVLLCGHYEGIDERAHDLFITDEISIGDYVLTGGELAAMVVIDAVMRHVPGLLGADGAHERDSHADGLLEGPQYTRPAEYKGLSVPTVLQQGNHAEVAAWRRRQQLRRTWDSRPDLLYKAQLSESDRYNLGTLADEDARAIRTSRT